MLTVEEALGRILEAATVLPSERVGLLESLGRVLAEDVFADISNPPFDNSAVDGYAVRAEDTAGATSERPRSLRSIGEVPAGSVAAERVTAGACIRIMTGAPLPDGADAVVMVEDTRATGTEVAILEEARHGDHVRRAGEDIREGARVLTAGALIGPAEVAMLAAMGQVRVACVRKPRVSVLSTGDEVVEITERPGPGQIRNSNGYALSALVREAGAELHSMRHVRDDDRETEDSFREVVEGIPAVETAATSTQSPPARTAEGPGRRPAPTANRDTIDVRGSSADVIVTSGGVSVGDRDFVKPVVERIGALDLWRVKMKPGKPLAFGRIGEALFFGLPGNPVSTMVTFELFVRPVLWKMAGRSDLRRLRVRAALTAPVDHIPGREEYVRACVELRAGQFVAVPTGAQGSGVLTSMLGANALLIIPWDIGSLPAGAMVDALVTGTVSSAEASNSQSGRPRGAAPTEGDSRCVSSAGASRSQQIDADSQSSAGSGQ